MLAKNPYETYQKNAVTTASPAELTLMLYNGCIKFIKQAKHAINEKDIAAKNTNIQKAQKIISELMVTLNRDVALSEQMLQLYDYVHRQLVEANMKNDDAILAEVEGYVVELRDTWKEAMQLQRKSQQQVGGRF